MEELQDKINHLTDIVFQQAEALKIHRGMESLVEIQELQQLNTETVERQMLKLGEEYGELCETILDSNDRETLLEAADCIQILFSILYQKGFTLEQIDHAISLKNEKWKNNYLTKS